MSKLLDLIDYTNDPKEMIQKLDVYLERMLQKHKPYSVFCVFDIDDTLFSTRDPDEFICHQKVGQYLYKKCNELNIPIHLVTARLGSKSSQVYLEEQLKLMGYSSYKSLYMQTKDEDTAAYKARIRNELTSERNACILNIGDQLTDHFSDITDEDYTELACVLNPNTYYIMRVAGDSALCSIKFPSLYFDEDQDPDNRQEVEV